MKMITSILSFCENELVISMSANVGFWRLGGIRILTATAARPSTGRIRFSPSGRPPFWLQAHSFRRLLPHIGVIPGCAAAACPGSEAHARPLPRHPTADGTRTLSGKLRIASGVVAVFLEVVARHIPCRGGPAPRLARQARRVSPYIGVCISDG